MGSLGNEVDCAYASSLEPPDLKRLGLNYLTRADNGSRTKGPYRIQLS